MPNPAPADPAPRTASGAAAGGSAAGTFPAGARSNDLSGPPRAGEGDDGELVAACLDGDDEAFAILVRRHQKVMLNLALRLVGNVEEACEVVQDAFLAAHRALAQFRGEARFSTWLAAITLNHARNRLAHLASRRRNEAFSLDAPIATAQGPVYPDPPAQAPDPLQELETRSLRARVARCIQALPLGFREVLVLRDLQDRSYEEIALLLKVRDGTVKSRLFRAREGVKDCLERAGGVP
jgi:RNA polymerase sigma-70 factor (ECF subfamily)